MTLEEAGRFYRYRLMNSLSNRYDYYIVTGHHTQDYIETVLINLIRGTGIKGLQTLQIYHNNIFRPLLKLHKEEINQILEKEKWKFFEDESNYENKYLRNRIRNKILPFFFSEGLNPDKLYDNFHNSQDESFDFSNSAKSLPSYLRIHSKTLNGISLDMLKRIIDLHLEILKLHPIKKQFVKELFSLLKCNDAFTHKNSEIIFWKSQKSDLYIIPFSSKILEKPKVEYINNELMISWNEKTKFFDSIYTIGFFSPGLKIFNGKFHKEISELLRENHIPVMVRKNIPILLKKQNPISVLLSFWDSSVKDYEKKNKLSF